MQWIELWLTTFGLIFAIIDPFGYVPTFLAMTAHNTEERRRLMLKKACGTAGLVLGFFIFFGQAILKFLGISIPALQISGGIILLLTGVEMLKIFTFSERLSHSEEDEATHKDDISIVPLAIPMLSGPGAIATVMAMSSKNPGLETDLAILVSVLVTLATTYFILRSAHRLLSKIGITGLNAATRIMGLLLCAMAVQFIINGIRGVM